MEKLELKHIAGYLPYGLKMISQNDFVSPLIRELRVDGFQFMIETRKPILRPMSDLTKEIDDIVVYESLSRRSKMDFDTRCPQVLKWSYEDVQILLKHHFDIHDLIGKGLAIDINTLTK